MLRYFVDFYINLGLNTLGLALGSYTCTTGKKKGGKKTGQWTADREFVQESFIIRKVFTEKQKTFWKFQWFFFQDTQKDTDDLEQKIRSEYTNRIRLFQISVKCSGPIRDIQNPVVRIGKISYQLSSLIASVDLAFKPFKVFQKPYPISCHPCWQFLEENIYKIDVDDTLTCISSLNDKLTRFTEDRKRKVEKSKENSSKRYKSSSKSQKKVRQGN